MVYKTGTWGDQAKCRSKNRRKYFREYREENPQKSSYTRERIKKLRHNIFKKYGNKCVKCGFSDWRALQIDHKNGGGQKERNKISKSKYLKKVLEDDNNNYQLLCANCNWIKRFENREISLKQGGEQRL